jgi:ADP-ribosylglycohydrolase
LVENAKAGGDSAARGMILGAIYGAADLMEKLPPDWISALKSYPEIQRSLGE